MEPIITRQEAVSNGLVSYFTGELCVNGHRDRRYTNTGICYECKRLRSKALKQKYPETYKAISKRTYNKNASKRIKQNAAWSKANPDKSRAIKKRNKNKHRKKYNAAEAARMRRKRTDPIWALSKNLSKSIWECLKGKKSGRSWKELVDFTPEQLIVHLENKFDEHMSWDNYGSYWHLDHVRPLSWFNLDMEFKMAWALSNLQPLQANKNMSKCNRYEG